MPTRGPSSFRRASTRQSEPGRASTCLGAITSAGACLLANRRQHCTSNHAISATHAHCPDDPCAIGIEADADGATCLGCLDGETDEGHVGKTFATLVPLRALGDALFGPCAKVSPRKIFGLLARASGAHIVNNEAGWLY